jgi:phage anti-repressor protein
MHSVQVSFFGERYPHFLFVDDIQFVKVREFTTAFDSVVLRDGSYAMCVTVNMADLK